MLLIPSAILSGSRHVAVPYGPLCQDRVVATSLLLLKEVALIWVPASLCHGPLNLMGFAIVSYGQECLSCSECSRSSKCSKNILKRYDDWCGPYSCTNIELLKHGMSTGLGGRLAGACLGDLIRLGRSGLLGGPLLGYFASLSALL